MLMPRETVPVVVETGRQAQRNGLLVTFDQNRMPDEIGELVELISRLRGVKAVDSTILVKNLRGS